MEYVPGSGPGSHRRHLDETWKTTSTTPTSGCRRGLTITMHPQIIGRAHHMLVLERLLQHMTSFDDVWFASLSDVFDAWQAASR